MNLDSNDIEAALNKVEADLDRQYQDATPGERRRITIMKDGVVEARKSIRELVSNPESRIPKVGIGGEIVRAGPRAGNWPLEGRLKGEQTC